MAFITFYRNSRMHFPSPSNSNTHSISDTESTGSLGISSIANLMDEPISLSPHQSPPPLVDSKAEVELVLWYHNASRKAMITRQDIMKQARVIFHDFPETERPESVDSDWVKSFLHKHDINLLNQHMAQQLRVLKKEIYDYVERHSNFTVEKVADFAVQVAKRLEIPTEKITHIYVKNIIKKGQN